MQAIKYPQICRRPQRRLLFIGSLQRLTRTADYDQIWLRETGLRANLVRSLAGAKEPFTATPMAQLLVLATPHITQHTPSDPASKIKHDYVIRARVLLVRFNIFIPAPAMTQTGHRGAVVKSGPQEKKRHLSRQNKIKLYFFWGGGWCG